MEIGIDPVAISIGSIELRWYGIMVALAVFVGVTVPIMLARKDKRLNDISREQILNLAIWAVPGGIIGARLIHVIDDWDYYWANPGEIIGGSGLGIFGAILGGTLVGLIYARIHRFPIGRTCDIAAFGLILAQAIGRVGCIFNGCCTGEATSLPWGVQYTNPDTGADLLAQQTHVHPTHIYELLWDLMIFGVIWGLRGKRQPPGAIYLIYISLYSIGRFTISFWRVNQSGFLGLQQAQIVSLLVLAIALGLLVHIYRKDHQQNEEVNTTAE